MTDVEAKCPMDRTPEETAMDLTHFTLTDTVDVFEEERRVVAKEVGVTGDNLDKALTELRKLGLIVTILKNDKTEY